MEHAFVEAAAAVEAWLRCRVEEPHDDTSIAAVEATEDVF